MSHFSSQAKCDMLRNNLGESFNRFILKARDKPILIMMETIKNKLMRRLLNKSVKHHKWIGPLCPKIQEKVDKMVLASTRCCPQHVGGPRYQVTHGASSQHVVNLHDRTCTCRKWELTGIPCMHVVACMFKTHEKPKTYVDDC
ncbi:hypothetical protein PTKIN_Ptkin19aG0043800 [Pterospermum kingtungense]